MTIMEATRSAFALVCELYGADGNIEQGVIRHRIASRVTHRSDGQFDALTYPSKRSTITSKQQLERVESVLTEIGARTAEPILQLKGTSVYERLGRRSAHIRYMNDIDIMDSASARNALTEIGYNRTSDGICHETGVYSRPGSPDIELHSHIPCWDCSEGEWRFNKLDTNPLWQGASEASMDGIFVPSVERCAAILVAGIYRDAVEHPVAKDSRIRLGDLLDFIELFERCNNEEFDQLITNGGLHTSLKFVRACIDQLVTMDVSESIPLTVEVTRGIAIECCLNIRELLYAPPLMHKIFRAEARYINWMGHRIEPGPDGVARAGVKQDTQSFYVEHSNEGTLSVKLPLSLFDSYKSEARVTTATGSVAVQFDHAFKRVIVKVAGHDVTPVSATGDQHELTMVVKVIGGNVCHVGTSQLTGDTGDSWRQFYGRLASGLQVFNL